MLGRARGGGLARGARIVNTTITALLTKHGMAKQKSAEILLAGCSSGGIGAMFNLDLLAQASDRLSAHQRPGRACERPPGPASVR